MPWYYEIDPARRLVHVHLTGPVTLPVLESLFAALKADAKFNPTYSEFTDLSESDSSSFPADKIRDLARNSIYSRDSKRAMLVANDLAFGLARMFGSYLEIHGATGINVFRDRAEALAWLEAAAKTDAVGQDPSLRV